VVHGYSRTNQLTMKATTGIKTKKQKVGAIFCPEMNQNKEYVEDFIRGRKEYFSDKECRACLICLKHGFFTPKFFFGLPFRDDRSYQFCKIRHLLEVTDYVWNREENDLTWLQDLTDPIEYKNYLRYDHRWMTTMTKQT